MHPRMDNPAFVVPGAMAALQALGKAVHDCGLSSSTLELVHLRASQLNGCSVCVFGHAHALRKAGEPDERIDTVGAWREAPYFSDAERAALSLTESVTRLSDRSDPVPDDVWAEAARHYDELQLAALVLAIASINVWNRLNAATHQVAGATW
ncbi:MAG: carboxymuconolactone decarboxylase family protein [Actinobacteria bacterium]|nr:carboxymuconolactone decarboxylase family protein [Actinomycetota bacterium]